MSANDSFRTTGQDLKATGQNFIVKRQAELAGEKNVRWGLFTGGIVAIISSIAGFSLSGNCNSWKDSSKTGWIVFLFVLGLLASIFMFLAAFEKPIVNWVATWGKKQIQ